MADVAQIAGVSAMTVSRALRAPGSVSPETLERIETAMAATGYVPNRVAGSLAARRTNLVGLVVPSLRNSLFAETVQGLSDTLGPEFDLLIADSGYSLEREEASVRAFLSQRVCGIVLHNTKHNAATRAMLAGAGVACVETGNLIRKPIDMCASFSNFEAGAAMADHLVSLGYKRVGFVSLPQENERASERRRGFVAAMTRHGLTPEPGRLRSAAHGLRSGAMALTALMEGPGIDAAFLTGDVLAAGALLEAQRRGWSVPGQVAIAGSDDSELQEQLQPALTTLRFPRYEIGRQAASMLLERLAGRLRGGAVLDLGFELVVRSSV
jgi:LacI family gluconate utilization system Gnt-I transcriptional repressor